MKKWLTFIVVALLVTGCAQNTAGLQIDGQTHKVLFGDKVLGSRLIVNDISTTQVDGRARGVVRLTSNYKANLHILYRFSWYNDQGLEVNTNAGPWRQAIVYGDETVSLSEVTLNPNGTQFRLQIREAND
ncbi:YcfL family protein [Vibrio sp. S4M6]|uniref:YcfL family protein n=1 Tax=Vibrio sinus TaxID=2946865 RepID=UPI00202A5349|nr:YcfL family protein [Vibrio sinus]MCL9782290.1 YcfL family protein [Vibrio sinus]